MVPYDMKASSPARVTRYGEWDSKSFSSENTKSRRDVAFR